MKRRLQLAKANFDHDMIVDNHIVTTSIGGVWFIFFMNRKGKIHRIAADSAFNAVRSWRLTG